MEPGQSNQETHQNLQGRGYEYDSSNKAYYHVSQEGVHKVYAENNGDRVCEPDSNDWRKIEDSNVK